MPRAAHAHVHTAILDLTPMYQPTTQLNWPAELQALAHDPDGEAVVAGFQSRLARYPSTQPSSGTRLVHSRGLVWRTGNRVLASGSYEHIVTTIPLIGLMKTAPEVIAAFGRCLADPAGQQTAFLTACIENAGLDEQWAMLRTVPTEHRSDAVDALYGHVDPEIDVPLIIALPQ